MRNAGLNGPVELTIPAASNLMLVVRLTTAGVIAKTGLTIDVMENLKLAVEEACNCIIGQENPPQRLRLRFECIEKALHIVAEADGMSDVVGEIDDTEMEIVRCILASLADDVAFEVRNGWIYAVRLQTALTL